MLQRGKTIIAFILQNTKFLWGSRTVIKKHNTSLALQKLTLGRDKFSNPFIIRGPVFWNIYICFAKFCCVDFNYNNYKIHNEIFKWKKERKKRKKAGKKSQAKRMKTQLTAEEISNTESSSSLMQPPGCASDSTTLFKPTLQNCM